MRIDVAGKCCKLSRVFCVHGQSTGSAATDGGIAGTHIYADMGPTMFDNCGRLLKLDLPELD